MPLRNSLPLIPLETAVLLVLLPPAVLGEAASETLSKASMHELQRRLGKDIRVLKIDEASHPAVVRSFGPPQLPACVLVRQGVELWRQQGLPETDSTVATLLEVARAG